MCDWPNVSGTCPLGKRHYPKDLSTIHRNDLSHTNACKESLTWYNLLKLKTSTRKHKSSYSPMMLQNVNVTRFASWPDSYWQVLSESSIIIVSAQRLPVISPTGSTLLRVPGITPNRRPETTSNRLPETTLKSGIRSSTGHIFERTSRVSTIRQWNDSPSVSTGTVRKMPRSSALGRTPTVPPNHVERCLGQQSGKLSHYQGKVALGRTPTVPPNHVERCPGHQSRKTLPSGGRQLHHQPCRKMPRSAVWEAQPLPRKGCPREDANCITKPVRVMPWSAV